MIWSHNDTYSSLAGHKTNDNLIVTKKNWVIDIAREESDVWVGEV